VFLTVLLLAVLLTALSMAGAGWGLLVIAALVALIPASDIALTVINWDVTHAFHPRLLAKMETESAVVLMQFDIDEFQAATIIVNPQDMDVKVTVFSPQTGQKKFEGKVYYKAVGGPMLKRDNWPNGTPIRITTEAVGIEAAEQVRDWLIVEDQKKKP